VSFDPILSNLRKHIALSPAEETYFVSLLKPKHFHKKEFILKEAQVCKHINFVNSGLLRAFYLNQENKESTIMFAISDWWVTDMHCFLEQKPAMLNIQSVSESEVLQLSKIDLDRLYLEIPKFERFFRILMQNAYVREQLRVIQNLSLSAEERYHNFLAKYPQIGSQVTQKQIASYLGITPEFLSVIRSGKTE
jgi:CRP-like cAMP-binding protein